MFMSPKMSDLTQRQFQSLLGPWAPPTSVHHHPVLRKFRFFFSLLISKVHNSIFIKHKYKNIKTL